MRKEVKVSVIIPVYNDTERLKKCLDALKKQKVEFAFEVLVVDNGSSDPENIECLVNRYRFASYFLESKVGSYSARNCGLKKASGEIVAFTDSDCIPDSLWIERSVSNLLSGIDRIAGHVELFYRSDKLSIVEIYEKVFAFNQKENANNGGAITANMVTWKSSFEKVGFFNEILLSGGDNEWAWRANDLGLKVKYCPDVIVYHPARFSLNDMLQKRRRVAGGIAISKREETYQSFFKVILRGFFPPVHIYKSVFKRSDLSFSEKFISTSLAYFIKIYTSVFILLYKMKIKKLERN